MTNITIQAGQDASVGRGAPTAPGKGVPGTYRLTAVGHATGRPEVCAAVSAIVYALGGYLKNLERAGAAELRSLLLESGAAGIEAEGNAARAPFEMAAIGLMQLAAKYPELVAVDAQDFFQIPGGIFAAL